MKKLLVAKSQLKTIILLTIICQMSSVNFSYAKGKGPGSTAANFLKIGVGARNIGMGETGATISDANSIYWNPAGLGRINTKEVSLMHVVWFEDIHYEHIAFGYPTRHGTFGIGVNYLSMSSIDGYDVNDDPGDTYKPYDSVGTISYSRIMFGMPIGINLKYIYSRIEEESAWAVATDIGCIYDALYIREKQVKFGLALQNIGTKMKFVSVGDPLPFNVKVGSSYDILNSRTHKLMCCIDINIPIDNEVRLNAGAEYTRQIGEKMSVSGRAGYKTNTDGFDAISGFTAGAGFSYAGYMLDYAWTPYYSTGDFPDLGDTHRISLGIKF